MEQEKKLNAPFENRNHPARATKGGGTKCPLTAKILLKKYGLKEINFFPKNFFLFALVIYQYLQPQNSSPRPIFGQTSLISGLKKAPN